MGSAQAKARRRTQAALSSQNAHSRSTPSTGSSSSTATQPRRYSSPGAGGGRTMTYAVTIPPGVSPGGRFAVMLGGQRHEFTCPPGAGVGSTVHVQGPAPASSSAQTSQNRSGSAASGGGATQPFYSVPPPQHQSNAGTRTYMVRVPQGVRPGQNFAASINGRRFVVACPPGVAPGQPLHIRVPDQQGGGMQQSQMQQQQPAQQTHSGLPSQQQTFMVTVPAGIRPGQQFMVMAGNQRVTVTCPPSCSGGSRVYVRVPVGGGSSGGLGGSSPHIDGKTAEDEDDYEVLDAALKEISSKSGSRKNQFERKVGDDGKLHWVAATPVREGKDGDLPTAEAEAEQSAVVLGAEDKFGSLGLVRSMSTNGSLSFISAHEAVIEVEGTGLSGMTPELLARASALPFKKKLKWFRQCRDKLRVPWERGHKKIRVRRDNILVESKEIFQTFKKAGGVNDMHRTFRFQFKGEEGIDAGGLAREWFTVVSEQLFNPEFGLFMGSGIGGEIVTINPQSHMADEHHLEYFHFAGQLLGKAFFDSQIVGCHLALQIYKHLLATPITFHDLEVVDGDLVSGLKQMMEMEDVSEAFMDFSITEESYGATFVVDLVPGGREKDVDNDNVKEYVQALVKYYMLDRIKDQLSSFLQGFYEVIPQPLLSIFDHREIELVLCGLPNIDKEDWQRNTIYAGQYSEKGSRHKVIKWFWKFVGTLDDSDAARLLQFSTGTARVPVQGFKLLQGRDGDVRKFTITSVKLKESVHPKSVSRCFDFWRGLVHEMG